MLARAWSEMIVTSGVARLLVSKLVRRSPSSSLVTLVYGSSLMELFSATSI